MHAPPPSPPLSRPSDLELIARLQEQLGQTQNHLEQTQNQLQWAELKIQWLVEPQPITIDLIAPEPISR